jgi:hypothetical protein
MKRFTFLLSVIAAFVLTTACAQEKKMASPPATAEGTIGNVKVTINYHQPSARGRKIMGGLVPFGEVWRTGANNTTSIEFSAPVKIEGKDLPAGKYGLYTIPGENEWVIIINKGVDWGAYKYKQEDDLLRINVKPKKTDSFVETFTIAVVKDAVELKWENTAVAFKVK